MINFTNDHTGFEITQQEVTEMTSKLITFCNCNKGSLQAKMVAVNLEGLEEALEEGEFRN